MIKQKTNPLISVVIATYNGEKFIVEQIESVINQTYKNLEIICIDDNSSDTTLSILKEYQKNYSNIKVFENEYNAGYIKNFEKGFLLANGEYIAPCDQDDIWKVEKIETLFAEIGDAQIIYSNSQLINSKGEDLGIKMSDIRKQIGYHSCLMYAIGNWGPGHAMLIKASLISKAVPFPTVVSHDLWLGFIATFYHPIKYIEKPLVFYRQHESNVFGVLKSPKSKKKNSKAQEIELLRNRMKILYQKCPNDLIYHKNAYKDLHESYKNFTLKSNWKRMITFFKYRDEILAYKKKSSFARWVFCIKMFVMLK